jgi:hypothetical protein
MRRLAKTPGPGDAARDTAWLVETAREPAGTGETARDTAWSDETARHPAGTGEVARDTARSGETAREPAGTGAAAEVLRRVVAAAAEVAAGVWLRSFAAALPTVVRPRSDDEVRGYLRKALVSQAETWVAEAPDAGLVGGMVLDGTELAQFYRPWTGEAAESGTASSRRPRSALRPGSACNPGPSR